MVLSHKFMVSATTNNNNPSSFYCFPPAAVDPRAQSSFHDYIGPIYLSFGKPAVQGTAEEFWDQGSHAKLWEVSENVTGARFLSTSR